MTPNKCKTQAHRANRRYGMSQRHGFSLIEVAVALAIFVFGALAIIRIFPGALGVIQTSESRAIATRMAQSSIARFAAAPETVPDAIYTANYDTQGNNDTSTALRWIDFEGSVVGNQNRNNSLSRDDSAFLLSKSALGQFRRVWGETQRIRNMGSGSSAIKYVLTNYPYVISNISNSGKADIDLKIYVEDTVENVRITDARGHLDFTNARLASTHEPFNDTSNGNPDRPPDVFTSSLLGVPAVNRDKISFYVSYRWRNAANRTQGTLDEPVGLPQNVSVSGFSWDTNTSGRVFWSDSGNSDDTIAGPVTVHIRIPIDSVFSSSTAAADAIRGYVQLPLTLTDAVSAVSLDYNVWDWRWIVDDNAPVNQPAPHGTPLPTATPEPQPRALTVPTRYIRDTNTDNDVLPANDAPIYTAFLAQEPGTGNPIRDYGAWDQNATTYGQIRAYSASRLPTTSDTERLMLVNHKAGQVIFNVNNTIAPQTRVVYQALDGWAQQLSVAAKSYIPYHPTLSGQLNMQNPREEWREFYWSVSDPHYLYFHPSEAGKSLLVSFEYDDGGTAQNITDAVVTIDPFLIDRPSTVPTNFMGMQPDGTTPCTKVARVELTKLLDVTTGADVTAIRSVKGASVQSRVAWLDGGQYTSATVMGYRLADQ